MSNPTHRHIKTGVLVFPEGYDPADLEPLAEAGWADHERAVVLHDLRRERDARLEASDKLMLPDRGFSEERMQQILQYRRALRDITEGDVLSPDWPTL